LDTDSVDMLCGSINNSNTIIPGNLGWVSRLLHQRSRPHMSTQTPLISLRMYVIVFHMPTTFSNRFITQHNF
jgi:hypothetical protein